MKYEQILQAIDQAIADKDPVAIRDLITHRNAETVRRGVHEAQQLRHKAVALRTVDPALASVPVEDIVEAFDKKYTKAEIEDKIKELKRKK